jgi:DNA-binding transcriptional MerR regulator
LSPCAEPVSCQNEAADLMAEAQNPNPPAVAPAGAETRYKIGDVCRIADVQPYVLRYWESEFPSLAPDRSLAGPRTYSARELRIIEQIKRLLYDEGYTIAGAKKKLEAEMGGRSAATATETESVPPAPRPREKLSGETKPRTSRPAAETSLPLAEQAPPMTTAPIAASAGSPLPVALPPAPLPPDPRLRAAVAELKELLKLLSRKS